VSTLKPRVEPAGESVARAEDTNAEDTSAAGPPHDPGPASKRRLAWGLVVPIAVAMVAVTVLSLVLDLSITEADRTAASVGWGSLSAAVGLIVTACGLPVLARYPRHRIGWIVTLTGALWTVDGLAESWVGYGLTQSPVPPLVGFSSWFVDQFGAILLVSLPLLLVLYPSGHFASGRLGIVSKLTVAMAMALPLALWFAPQDFLYGDEPVPVDSGMPALPFSDDTFTVLLSVGRTLTLLSLPVAVVVLFLRQRNTRGVERDQFRWLAWAAVMCVIFTALAFVIPQGLASTTALVLCLAVTGVSIAIGILRPDLTDVNALMGGTLVYAAVGASVVALDLALVAGLNEVIGSQLDERQVTLLVLLVAVAAYGPVRAWLGAAIRRMLVGRRGDRYDVVAGLAERLEQSGDVQTQLPALATAVATTFKLGYVRVEVFGHGGDTLSATYGELPPATREIPIRYGTDVVGRLVLTEHGLRSMLSRRDQELLFDVVRQAAMAVRSARLAEDLQASRERLVLAREDDRRRIRRDLHDGLGPALGGVAMRIEAAGNALESDPTRARALLQQSRDDIADALADVRRLVHGLRPPALDDLGLLDALGQLVERARLTGVTVDLDAEELPALPAAVEVATYRIVSEALTNCLRHAEADACRIVLAPDSAGITITVSDDGAGIADDVVAGVGLSSMRERAEELGGRTDVTCPPDGGTVVRAWIPFSPDINPTTEEHL
jgi:signal transduction histidine kinase